LHFSSGQCLKRFVCTLVLLATPVKKSAFVLSTLFPQVPLLLYLGYGQRPGTVVFSYEVPLTTVLLLLNLSEISISYKALAKLISRQTASFFRLVQTQDDDDKRLLEEKEQ
jgi:hypothetical protein